MTEFEEKNGELIQIRPDCDHIWGKWIPTLTRHGAVKRRDCIRCDQAQLLVPKGHDEEEIEPVSVDFGELFYGILGVIAMVICVLILYAGATGKL